MSGREMCYNQRCDFVGTQHEGMCIVRTENGRPTLDRDEGPRPPDITITTNIGPALIYFGTNQQVYRIDDNSGLGGGRITEMDDRERTLLNALLRHSARNIERSSPATNAEDRRAM